MCSVWRTNTMRNEHMLEKCHNHAEVKWWVNRRKHAKAVQVYWEKKYYDNGKKKRQEWTNEKWFDVCGRKKKILAWKYTIFLLWELLIAFDARWGRTQYPVTPCNLHFYSLSSLCFLRYLFTDQSKREDEQLTGHHIKCHGKDQTEAVISVVGMIHNAPGQHDRSSVIHEACTEPSELMMCCYIHLILSGNFLISLAHCRWNITSFLHSGDCGRSECTRTWIWRGPASHLCVHSWWLFCRPWEKLCGLLSLWEWRAHRVSSTSSWV